MKRYKKYIIFILCFALCVSFFCIDGNAIFAEAIGIGGMMGMNGALGIGTSASLPASSPLWNDYSVSITDAMVADDINPNMGFNTADGSLVYDYNTVKWYADFVKTQTHDFTVSSFAPTILNPAATYDYGWEEGVKTITYGHASYANGIPVAIVSDYNVNTTDVETFYSSDIPVSDTDTVTIQAFPYGGLNGIRSVGVQTIGNSVTYVTLVSSTDGSEITSISFPRGTTKIRVWVSYAVTYHGRTTVELANTSVFYDPIRLASGLTDPGDDVGTVDFTVNAAAVSRMYDLFYGEDAPTYDEPQVMSIRPINPVTGQNPLVGLPRDEALQMMYDIFYGDNADGYQIVTAVDAGTLDEVAESDQDKTLGLLATISATLTKVKEYVASLFRADPPPPAYQNFFGNFGGGGGLTGAFTGIWHYVIEFVASLGAGISLFFGTIYAAVPYALVLPVYASAVVVIVVSLYKKFITR